MKNKTQKILYWVATGLFSAMMVLSAAMYLTQNAEIVKGFTHGGLPLYLIPLLGIAKLAGAVALLVPGFSKIKEWAYAGFTFNLIGAVWVHASTGENIVGPLIFILVLGASYFLKNKVYTVASQAS